MLLTVNWTPSKPISPYLYGVNNYKLHVPATPETHALMKEVGAKLFRFHLGPLMDHWTDSTTKDWIVSKVLDPYLEFKADPDPSRVVLQTISKFPTWMLHSQPGILDPSEHQAYADLCARLVRIINIDNGLGVKYWEPTNERNKLYLDAKKLPELYQIHNLCYQAMKAVDPTIQVGGLALTYDDGMVANGFVDASKDYIDFLSFHRYSSTSKAESTPCIMSRTPNYKGYVQKFKDIVTAKMPGKVVPISLNEYSINYDYRDNETRISTHVGVAWFASVLKYMAEAGLEQGTIWNFQDGIYGLVGNDLAKRPAFDLYRLLNQYFVGDLVPVTTNDPNVEGFGVIRADGSKGLIFWHKGDSVDTVVSIKSDVLATDAIYGYKIDHNGFSSYKVLKDTFNLGRPIAMVPYRVVILPDIK